LAGVEEREVLVDGVREWTRAYDRVFLVVGPREAFQTGNKPAAEADLRKKENNVSRVHGTNATITIRTPPAAMNGSTILFP
jgi:hypothetical protein